MALHHDADVADTPLVYSTPRWTECSDVKTLLHYVLLHIDVFATDPPYCVVPERAHGVIVRKALQMSSSCSKTRAASLAGPQAQRCWPSRAAASTYLRFAVRPPSQPVSQ